MYPKTTNDRMWRTQPLYDIYYKNTHKSEIDDDTLNAFILYFLVKGFKEYCDRDESSCG